MLAMSCFEVRHRWWPNEAFKQDHQTRDEMKHTSLCQFDSYTESYMKHCGDCLDGDLAKAVPMCLQEVLETDTASTERCHGRNERRRKFKVQTHAGELAETSA